VGGTDAVVRSAGGCAKLAALHIPDAFRVTDHGLAGLRHATALVRAAKLRGRHYVSPVMILCFQPLGPADKAAEARAFPVLVASVQDVAPCSSGQGCVCDGTFAKWRRSILIFTAPRRGVRRTSLT